MSWFSFLNISFFCYFLIHIIFLLFAHYIVSVTTQDFPNGGLIKMFYSILFYWTPGESVDFFFSPHVVFVPQAGEQQRRRVRARGNPGARGGRPAAPQRGADQPGAGGPGPQRWDGYSEVRPSTVSLPLGESKGGDLGEKCANKQNQSLCINACVVLPGLLRGCLIIFRPCLYFMTAEYYCMNQS